MASTQPPLIYGYLLYSTSIPDATDNHTDVDPSQNPDICYYLGTAHRAVLGNLPS